MTLAQGDVDAVRELRDSLATSSASTGELSSPARRSSGRRAREVVYRPDGARVVQAKAPRADLLRYRGGLIKVLVRRLRAQADDLAKPHREAVVAIRAAGVDDEAAAGVEPVRVGPAKDTVTDVAGRFQDVQQRTTGQPGAVRARPDPQPGRRDRTHGGRTPGRRRVRIRDVPGLVTW